MQSLGGQEHPVIVIVVRTMHAKVGGERRSRDGAAGGRREPGQGSAAGGLWRAAGPGSGGLGASKVAARPIPAIGLGRTLVLPVDRLA